MVVFLSEELIEQVIIRVQCVKSILRCTAVCKSWCALINSPRFINIHMCHPNKDKYLLCYYGETRTPSYSKSGQYYSINCDNKTFHEQCMLLPLDRLQVFEVKVCNGLICYKNVANPAHLCLWNPAIRKLKIIPKSPHSSIHRGPDSFVLWFDTKSNDYKISTICCIRDISTRNAFMVELYSLSTNSWKVVSENAPCAPRRLVCVNGILLWHDITVANSVIISLDSENGIFEKRVEAGSSNPISLQSFGDEYICVFGYGVGKKHICCRFVQVYDENLNKLCEFDFKDYKVDLLPVGFKNNDKLLFWNMDDNRSIVSFNLETAEIKDYAQRWSCCSLQWVTPFVETLALLNDKNAVYEPNLSVDTRGKIDEEP